MNYKDTSNALRTLMSRRTYETDPATHVAQLKSESDRSSIILCAAGVEDFLTAELENHMTNLNTEERQRIFDFQGPLGTFSSKIRIAQGIGLIDRQLRKDIELVKSMRNAAAHCVDPVNFSDEPFRSAVILLCPEKYRVELLELDGRQLRTFFELTASALWRSIMGKEPPSVEERINTAKNASSGS